MKCRGHKRHIHTLSSFQLEMPWQYKNLMTQNDIKVSESMLVRVEKVIRFDLREMRYQRKL